MRHKKQLQQSKTYSNAHGKVVRYRSSGSLKSVAVSAMFSAFLITDIDAEKGDENQPDASRGNADENDFIRERGLEVIDIIGLNGVMQTV